MNFNTLTDDDFGIELVGCDARTLTDEQISEIRAKVYRHRFVVVRAQEMALAEYVEWGRRVGRLQIYPQTNYHHPQFPEVFVTSNVTVDGRPLGVARTGYYWHTDCSWLDEPLPFTMLYPAIVQHGRETCFIDMAKVYRQLPPSTQKQLLQLHAHHGHKGRYKIRVDDVGKPLHELVESLNQRMKGADHPVVIHHPVTKEPILYISHGFTEYLVDYDPREGEKLLTELYELSHRPENVYTHEYRVGDILLWDNRFLLHKSGRAPQDEEYLIHRLGIFDGKPFYISADSAARSAVNHSDHGIAAEE